MKYLKTHKKLAVSSLALVVALMTGGAAYAYFTSTGTGAGAAGTVKAQNVTISQVGAGYDSLVPTNAYTQDQCLSGCDGPSELGNDITLNTTNASQLVSVVVGIDNWGQAVANVPMTLTINNTVAGPISDTQDFSFPIATNPHTDPSETNVTFDFSSQDAFVDSEFVYGITFNTTPGAASVAAADSLNVALSSSTTDLSTGTDTDPGTIYVDDTWGNNGDFPACDNGNPALSAGTFESLVTNCGPYNSGNPGAYGNEVPTDDIPAVEVNIVGGQIEGLYPGDSAQPIEYAINNPGATPVEVQTVGVSVDQDGSGNVKTPGGSSVTGCEASWYTINNSPQTLDTSVSSGTTLFTTTSPIASDLSIAMTDPAVNQDDCEGANVGLTFTSN
jgi:hypothetical protein